MHVLDTHTLTHETPEANERGTHTHTHTPPDTHTHVDTLIHTHGDTHTHTQNHIHTHTDLEDSRESLQSSIHTHTHTQHTHKHTGTHIGTRNKKITHHSRSNSGSMHKDMDGRKKNIQNQPISRLGSKNTTQDSTENDSPDSSRSSMPRLSNLMKEMESECFDNIPLHPCTIPEEVVIFIHGFNVELDQGCAQLAHLVAFSKLPPYIRPFLFNWPGNIGSFLSPIMYPWAKNRAHHNNLGEAFACFVKNLCAQGVRYCHILSHSCGARMFFCGMNKCYDQNLFTYCDELAPHESRDNKRITVRSVLLLNPDYPLDTFLHNDFRHLRGVCNHITIYADTRDRALTFSEYWNREKCLGKRIFDLRTDCGTALSCVSAEIYTHPPLSSVSADIEDNAGVLTWGHKYKDESDAKLRQNETDGRDSAAESPLLPSAPHTHALMYTHTHTDTDVLPTTVVNHIESPTYRRASHTLSRERDNDMFLSRADNTSICTDNTTRRLWFDVDVIDTTFVDKNTDVLKHCFYNLNREIVDDIRDVIVCGIRAQDRVARLDLRRGNVYCLRIAPRDVTGLYG